MDRYTVWLFSFICFCTRHDLAAIFGRPVKTRMLWRPRVLNVTKVRYVSVLMHGALCALGGAYLSMGYLTQYVENMTAGRGFIAIAAIAFARAIPSRVIFSVLLFAFVESIANRLQSVNVPSYFALMLPYIITINCSGDYIIQEKRRRVETACYDNVAQKLQPDKQ